MLVAFPARLQILQAFILRVNRIENMGCIHFSRGVYLELRERLKDTPQRASRAAEHSGSGHLTMRGGPQLRNSLAKGCRERAEGGGSDRLTMQDGSEHASDDMQTIRLV